MPYSEQNSLPLSLLILPSWNNTIRQSHTYYPWRLSGAHTLVAPSVFPVFLFWTRFSGPERNSDGIPIIPVKFRFSGVDFFDRNLRTGIPELPEFRRLITYTQCILRADPGYDCCTHSTKGTVEPKLWQQCHSTCRSLPVLREYYGYSST